MVSSRVDCQPGVPASKPKPPNPTSCLRRPPPCSARRCCWWCSQRPLAPHQANATAPSRLPGPRQRHQQPPRMLWLDLLLQLQPCGGSPRHRKRGPQAPARALRGQGQRCAHASPKRQQTRSEHSVLLWVGRSIGAPPAWSLPPCLPAVIWVSEAWHASWHQTVRLDQSFIQVHGASRIDRLFKSPTTPRRAPIRSNRPPNNRVPSPKPSHVQARAR